MEYLSMETLGAINLIALNFNHKLPQNGTVLKFTKHTLMIFYRMFVEKLMLNSSFPISDRSHGYDQYYDRFYERPGYRAGGGYYDNRNFRPYDETYR